MKKDRLNYLLSRNNIKYLNKIDYLQKNGRYKECLGIEYIPPQFRKTKCVFAFFLALLGVFLPFIALGMLIKALLSSMSQKKINYSFDYLFLLTSPALPRVIKRTNIDLNNGRWLLYPWKKSNAISPANQLSVFCLLSVRDIIDSVTDFIRTYYYVWRKEGLLNLPLTLGSLKWYLYNAALRHIPLDTKMVFCNHLDQPVVLIDKLPHSNKLLVQHGTSFLVHNPSNIPYPFLKKSKQGFWTYNPPYRYKTITVVYAFTQKEEEALSMSILNCKPDFYHVGYSLKLTDYNLDKQAILIVGYYDMFYDKESMILEGLKDFDVVVYLKNHPTISPSKYDSFKEKYNFVLIIDGTFPKVDLVLSYDSTLALEYEALGVPVLYYDNIDFRNQQTMVDAIDSCLK